jgi:hypothetical protein
MIVRDGGGCRELAILPRTALYDAECFFSAKMRSPARSAVPPPSALSPSNDTFVGRFLNTLGGGFLTASLKDTAILITAAPHS